MTDRDFDQHITRIHSTCVNLFVCFRCNVYHFRCVLCICACSVYGCIRRYSYGRVQIDRCRNVRTKTRVCPVLFLFISFFLFFFFVWLHKTWSGTENDTTHDNKHGKVLSHILDGKGTNFDFELLTNAVISTWKVGRTTLQHSILFYQRKRTTSSIKKKKIKSSVDWTFIVTSREEDKVHLMELAFVHFTAMTINR